MPSLSASAAAEREVNNRTPIALWKQLSVNDWLTLVYVVGLNLALIGAPPHPEKGTNLLVFGSMLFGYVTVIALVRSGKVTHRKLNAFLYRTAHLGALLGSYLAFRSFLPVVNPSTLDTELYEFDLRWFGFEPAVFLDDHITPFLTEWFAFFYYGYFYVLMVHLFPILYGSKNRQRLAQFGFGMTAIAAVGHTLYMLVPGFGPYFAIADQFQHELPTGFWWQTVLAVVENGGAQKDIFPSLHTGFPSFIVLFSFHNRKHLPYRYTWPVLAFIVANIIGATMYLRWHYLVDVIAGLLLAISAHFASIHIPKRERVRRQKLELGEIWPPWK